MKVLITGGLGYIGSVLVQALQKATEIEQIVIYDNFARKNFGLLTGSNLNPQKVRIIKGDLLNGHLLRKSIKDMDVIVHLAAKVSGPTADIDSHSFEQINHWGTAQLVDALEENPVQHLIFLSSTTVYGHSTKGVDLNTIPNPTTYYGISKYDAEQEIKRLEGIVPYHILRSGNVYGYSPSLRINTVVNKFLFEANFLNQIHIVGDGQQVRPFIYIKNLVAVLQRLVRGLKVPLGIHNLYEHNFSINDLADAIQSMYPNLDKISLNKDYKTRSLKLIGACELLQLAGVSSSQLLEELEEFKSYFAY